MHALDRCFESVSWWSSTAADLNQSCSCPGRLTESLSAAIPIHHHHHHPPSFFSFFIVHSLFLSLTLSIRTRRNHFRTRTHDRPLHHLPLIRFFPSFADCIHFLLSIKLCIQQSFVFFLAFIVALLLFFSLCLRSNSIFQSSLFIVC